MGKRRPPRAFMGGDLQHEYFHLSSIPIVIVWTRAGDFSELKTTIFEKRIYISATARTGTAIEWTGSRIGSHDSSDTIEYICFLCMYLKVIAQAGYIVMCAYHASYHDLDTMTEGHRVGIRIISDERVEAIFVLYKFKEL